MTNYIWSRSIREWTVVQILGVGPYLVRSVEAECHGWYRLLASMSLELRAPRGKILLEVVRSGLRGADKTVSVSRPWCQPQDLNDPAALGISWSRPVRRVREASAAALGASCATHGDRRIHSRRDPSPCPGRLHTRDRTPRCSNPGYRDAGRPMPHQRAHRNTIGAAMVAGNRQTAHASSRSNRSRVSYVVVSFRINP